MKAGEKILTAVCVVLVFFVIQALASGPLAVGLESEFVSPLGFEGNSNTFYGTEAGNGTAGDNDGATFIGYRAGYSNTANNNSFLGAGAGYSNTFGTQNSFFGAGAGYSNTTGYSNSFFGNQAGYYNTGSQNSFIGDQAGYCNTSGNYNSFLGLQAGFANITGSQNSFIGYRAGVHNTEGHSNSFVGFNAGYSNTTGNYNSFFGFDVGYSNTIGGYNSFIGYQAGYSNTTGKDNSFFGTGAGYSNSTGDSNSFFGTGAGYSNTFGIENSFFGTGAGNLNTTGYSNSFFGHQAGFYTTGNYNSFIGSEAGYSNTTGGSNSFVGYRAGWSNSTGLNNTFLGHRAGYSNTSGTQNSFFGYGVGSSNTTGTNNSFLGTMAGFLNTTGWGNVFLGHRAGFNETGSHRLYIDNSDTSSPLIYGEFDNDIVRINGRLGVLRSPGASYQLDVNGTVNATSFVGDGSGLTNLSEVDPKVGTLTAGRWCTSNGTTVGCTQTAPLTAEVDPKVGSLTAGRWCTSNGSTVSCTQTAPVTAEMDPKVGSLTSGRWCTSNGSTVSCTQTAPITAEVDPKVGSNTLNRIPRWDGSSLVTGSIQDDGTDVTVLRNLNVVAPDNGLIYLTNTLTDNTTKGSRMVLNHYSNTQLPLYLFGAASTATANFVAFGGGNTIGNAATQLDLFTAPNTTTPVGSPRLTIIGNGNVGIGTQSPTQPLQMASGAHVTAGGVWTNASSREYKDNIRDLKAEDAMEALKGLHPVTFNYKASANEGHVGFIAEDVPELVATKDRKGLSPMDIVAVLTKVVQEQQTLNITLMKKLAQLEEKLEGLQTGGIPLHVISHK